MHFSTRKEGMEEGERVSKVDTVNRRHSQIVQGTKKIITIFNNNA